MTPEYYALEWRRFATIAQNTNPALKRIACGPDSFNYEWTRRFLEVAREKPDLIDGLALHYYCFNKVEADDVTEFGVNDWYRLLWQATLMQELITRHWSIVRGFGLQNRAKLYIDEWGAWHKDGTGPTKGYNLYEQQSSMRDALVSAIYLNIFNNNCEKIDMANAAQLVNNLHCLFLSEGENCITTPTYHVFDMFKTHMGGKCLRTENTAGIMEVIGTKGDKQYMRRLYSSASVKDGTLTVTVANTCHDKEIPLSLELTGIKAVGEGEMTVLVGDSICAHNTFDDPNRVTPDTKAIKASEISDIKVPAASVVAIRIPVEEV